MFFHSKICHILTRENHKILWCTCTQNSPKKIPTISDALLIEHKNIPLIAHKTFFLVLSCGEKKICCIFTRNACFMFIVSFSCHISQAEHKNLSNIVIQQHIFPIKHSPFFLDLLRRKKTFPNCFFSFSFSNFLSRTRVANYMNNHKMSSNKFWHFLIIFGILWKILQKGDGMSVIIWCQISIFTGGLELEKFCFVSLGIE